MEIIQIQTTWLQLPVLLSIGFNRHNNLKKEKLHGISCSTQTQRLGLIVSSVFKSTSLWSTGCWSNTCTSRGSSSASSCSSVWPHYQLRYLRFSLIVLSSQCQIIFTVDEPNQSLPSCQQQQLPWQHTGRSTLWEPASPLQKDSRESFAPFAQLCTHKHVCEPLTDSIYK